MAQKRYLTFLGDPADKPLHFTFHRSVDAKGVMLGIGASAFGAVMLPADYATANGPGDLVSASSMNLVIAMAVLRGIENLCLRQLNHNGNRRCIDTSPEPTMPDPSPEERKLARQMRLAYLIVGGLACVYSALKIAGYSGGNITPTGVSDVAVGAACMLRAREGFTRFNKVAKGQWRIVNLPPPEHFNALAPR